MSVPRETEPLVDELARILVTAVIQAGILVTPCSFCLAPAAHPCRGPGGEVRSTAHIDRVEVSWDAGIAVLWEGLE